MCFSLRKNHELNVKLGWAGARERKIKAFYVTFILSEGIFWTFFISMYCVLKKLSDYIYFYISRSSHQSCSVRKGVLRNLRKFGGKRQCQSLFFNKVAGLGSEDPSPPWGMFNNLWSILEFSNRAFSQFKKSICTHIKTKLRMNLKLTNNCSWQLKLFGDLVLKKLLVPSNISF